MASDKHNDAAMRCFGEMLAKGQILEPNEVYWNAAVCRQVIASALAQAERDGTKRAAEIVRAETKTEVQDRGFRNGFFTALNSALTAILSEVAEATQ